MDWEATLGVALGGSVNGGRVKRGRSSLVLEQIDRSAGRVEEVEGTLARSALVQTQPSLTVVTLPKVGAELSERTARFAAKHLPELAWALVGHDGSFRVRVPAWSIDAEHRPAARQQKHVEHRPPRYSEADRFLLKLLLLRHAGPELWRRPAAARDRYTTGAELARTSGLTPSIVHRFLTTFEGEGFVRFDDDGFDIARPAVVLRQLLDLETAKPRRRVALRSPTRDEPSDAWLARVGDAFPVAVGGFEACRRRGWLHVRGAHPWELHVPHPRDVRRLADTLGLVECPPDRATLFVLQPPPPRTRAGHQKLAGAVGLWACVSEDPVPIVDALEAALDCVSHPNRGRAQAEHLVQRVLRSVS